MRALIFALALLCPLVADAAPERILVLHQQAWAAQEAALVDALRIYTRDLGCTIVLARRGPAPGQGPEQLAAAGRRAGALLVAWFASGEADGLRLNALRVTSGDLLSAPVIPRDDLDVAAPTLALKLRAFLTGEVTPTAPAAARPAASTPPAPAPPPPAPSPGPPTMAVARAAAPRTRPVHLELGLGYGFDMPPDPTWLRHGLQVRVGLVFPRSRVPLALELDGAVSTRPGVEVPPYQVTVNDIPIGLALSARLVRRRYLLAAGPRASLHFYVAEAAGAGLPGGDALRLSAGLGAQGQVRYRALRWLDLVLGLGAEAILPRQRFTVAGQEAADLGAFRLGASLGAVLQVL